MNHPEQAGTSPERFLELATTIEPRMSANTNVGGFEEPEWQGKYAELAHGYYNGLVEDLVEAGMPKRPFKGGILGYRVYGAILAQVPHALMTFAPDIPKNNLGLYEALTSSLMQTIGPVAGIPSKTNKQMEQALSLRQLPQLYTRLGYEFYLDNGNLRYRAKPEIVESIKVEVSEQDIALSGMSYEALMAKRCVLPMEYHARIWQSMVSTCVFNYGYINADIDEIRKTLPDTNSSRVQ